MTTRRRVLQVSLVGSAALALSGLGLSIRPGTLREPDRPLRVLTQRQYSVLIALAEAVLPTGPGLPSPEEAEVGHYIDAQLAEGPPSMAEEACLGLRLLDNALVGTLLGGRTRPFSAQDLERRRQVLLEWSEGRVEVQRTIVKGLTALVTVAYWSSPKVWGAVGYPGPPPVPWPDAAQPDAARPEEDPDPIEPSADGPAE